MIWRPVQLNKESEVRESTAILFDADIAMRLVLDEDSHTNATILFDKVRQGQRGKSLPVEIEGWYQTIDSGGGEERFSKLSNDPLGVTRRPTLSIVCC